MVSYIVTKIEIYNMTKHQVKFLILKGYHILKNGVPTKVEDGLWEYLDTLDEKDDSIVILEDALKLSDEELALVKYKA